MTPPTPAQIEAGARAWCIAMGRDPDAFLIEDGVTTWSICAIGVRAAYLAMEAAAWVAPSAEWPAEAERVLSITGRTEIILDGLWSVGAAWLSEPPRLVRPIPQPPTEGE